MEDVADFSEDEEEEDFVRLLRKEKFNIVERRLTLRAGESPPKEFELGELLVCVALVFGVGFVLLARCRFFFAVSPPPPV
jgi:hypothetical protein